MDDYSIENSTFKTQHFRVSWSALIIGLAIGVVSGLVYAWVFAPIVEYDTEPWQLSRDAQTQYLVAVSLAYRADGDLRRAVDRLLELRLPQDPFDALAETACDLFRQGVDDTSERNAIEALIALYSPQGRSGCADQSNLFAVAPVTPTPFPTVLALTPTVTPVGTKTPTPNSPLNVTPPTAAPRRTATPVPQPDDFSLAPVRTFCSLERAGVIEVIVQVPGEGQLPGVPVRVLWEGGSDTFFTGLKPERGLGFADFQMDANGTYRVEIPERSGRTTDLTASPCTTESGDRSTTSYTVIFVRDL